MRPLQLAPVFLLAAGIGLVVWAALHGGATAYLILVFPVLVGNSGLFLGGVFLIIVGMILIPFTLLTSEPRERGSVPSAGSRPSVSTGGVILIGPVPILFGAWKNVSPRQRWGLAILGVALLAVVLVVILFA
ncbi:MAG: DUF131 domain-containing protein [Thermoplasmata archaeon]